MTTVRVVRDVAGLRAFVPRIEQLAADLCEPNVFYEPWMLLPMIEHFGRGRQLRFVLLFEGPGDDDRLCGFFPLERGRLHHLAPLPCYRMWLTQHCFRCAPLVRAGALDDCLMAFFRWFHDDPGNPRLLELSEIGDGEVQRGIDRLVAAEPALHCARSARGSMLVRRAASAEAYLRRHGSSRFLQQWRRKSRRLADLGEVRFTEPRTAPELEAAIEEFLALEASGWKGRAGSALAAQPADRRFFAEVVREAFRRRRLSLLCLRLDGRPIAARCAFAAPPGSFVFKIAYDEAYAKYSPGLLLEMEGIQRLHGALDGAAAPIEWLDSCAQPDSGLYLRVGSEMRQVYRYRIAAGAGPGMLLVRLLPHISVLYRLFAGYTDTAGNDPPSMA